MLCTRGVFSCACIMVALVFGLGTPAQSQQSAVALNPISADGSQAFGPGPFALPCAAPCILPNVQASGGGNPVNETLIASNPKNTLQLLSGGNDYNCPTIQGFYGSSDGGSTWSHSCLSSLEFFGGGGQPILGYDAKNNAYAGGLNVRGRPIERVVVLAKSTNNGLTWGAPVLAVNPTFIGGFTDHPRFLADTSSASPHLNSLYISTTQMDSSGVDSFISVSRSTDGGITWTTAAVDSTQTFPNLDQFSNMAIGKDGSVYVAWMRCVAVSAHCASTTVSMLVSKSTDGGNTWSAPVTMANVNLVPDSCNCAFYGSLPNTAEPVTNIPAIGIDNSTGTHAGFLYTVMYNWTGTQMKVEVTHSSDGGVTWSSAVPVAPATATGDQFFPWLSVSRGGIVGVTWLDRRNDPLNLNYEAFAALSTNGGTGFGTNHQIATVPSNPTDVGICMPTGTCFMGDYTGNTWAGAKLFASWMDTRTGSGMQNEVGGWFQ